MRYANKILQEGEDPAGGELYNNEGQDIYHEEHHNPAIQ